MSTKYQNNQAQEAIRLMQEAQNAINSGNRAQADQLAQQAYSAAQRASNPSVAAAVVRHANEWGPVQAAPPPPPPPTPPPSTPSGGGYTPSYSAPSYSPTAYTPPPPPPPPKPPAWITTSDFKEPKGVKQADPDIVIFNTTPISPEFLIETNYEDLSGMELINISRSDIINGASVSYSPIKNLSALRRKYNPNNIISMPELSSSYFSRFGIDLILRGISKPFFDSEGNLVIEIQDVKDDEVIEVEISQSGTINEVDFL
jgi:hypothetical protein